MGMFFYHLPCSYVGVLSFRLACRSYSVMATGACSFEGLVAMALFEPTVNYDRATALYRDFWMIDIVIPSRDLNVGPKGPRPV